MPLTNLKWYQKDPPPITEEEWQFMADDWDFLMHEPGPNGYPVNPKTFSDFSRSVPIPCPEDFCEDHCYDYFGDLILEENSYCSSTPDLPECQVSEADMEICVEECLDSCWSVDIASDPDIQLPYESGWIQARGCANYLDQIEPMCVQFCTGAENFDDCFYGCTDEIVLCSEWSAPITIPEPTVASGVFAGFIMLALLTMRRNRNGK